MRTADDIPPQVRELQRAVAAPDASAWVSAVPSVKSISFGSPGRAPPLSST